MVDLGILVSTSRATAQARSWYAERRLCALATRLIGSFTIYHLAIDKAISDSARHTMIHQDMHVAHSGLHTKHKAQYSRRCNATHRYSDAAI